MGNGLSAGWGWVLWTAVWVGAIDWKEYGDTLANNYIRSGVMEEDERSWLFRTPGEFEEHLWVVQFRISGMEPDCPALSDVYLLPRREVIVALHDTATDYLRWLRQKKVWATDVEIPAWQWRIEQQRERVREWEAMRECVSWSCGTEGRRLRLQALRDLVGRKRYGNQEWTPALPHYAYDEGYRERP